MSFKDLKCDLTNCISNIGHVCIGKYENCPYYKLRKENNYDNDGMGGKRDKDRL